MEEGGISQDEAGWVLGAVREHVFAGLGASLCSNRDSDTRILLKSDVVGDASHIYRTPVGDSEGTCTVVGRSIPST